ncbi:3-hydroxyacyl-CoA dehydrogenase [Steroidobacter denitrificans]|uniref:3-hydroxyacyl-CoA dehydrogenase n=1 Tax=Steroidobacter denitrificans TaxID=465721 RepID=A0A127F9Y5_STEDE|nr:3-hydroxyacyl-CoA dehydrogenase NAD-binding domain-containing protein [Steroidobacter denitrificans]AMN46369.1 3-hydroxyacyl-CoA dehydrogenase [Steroidobacter denitrificans]
MSENFKGFIYDKDADGIVTLTMDMAGPVNAMNADFRAAIEWLADRLEAEEGLTGVVITSGKSTFFAGGDIKEMAQARAADAGQWFEIIERMKAQLRRIEKLPVPIAAAINGAALGGGLEICLACNYRVAWNSSKVAIGLPEVTLGLLPGSGGVVRSIHMLGLEKALPLILEGTRLAPAKARESGLVDALVDDLEELLPAAKAWVKANPDAGLKPWDKKGYAMRDSIYDPRVTGLLSAASPQYFAKTRGLLPAPARILSLAHDAVCVDFDAALRIETRSLVELMLSPVCKNLINSTFLQMNRINSGASRPRDIGKTSVSRVGILGAGMMGQGIAYACAMAGIETVLKDVSLQAAEKGRAYTDSLLTKRLAKGSLTEEQKAVILARIKATADNADLRGCDLIVEAVFESIDLKKKVIQETESLLAEGGVFGSNTSTLPITLLAGASRRPENFIGVHFFSPVDKMPLVEIICGKQTSEATLAKAYDFARQIGKTPIVVNDSLGFFTSRVFGTYLDEGCRLLVEGLDPIFIDNMGRLVGMPVGPLTVFDEVSLELNRKVAETQRQLGIYGSRSDSSVAVEVAERLTMEFGRGGRHHGGGFYEYPAGGPKLIWPGLYELYRKHDVGIDAGDAKDRLLFRQVVEALKCLQEGVLRSVPEGNIGSLMGIGAPVWTGGFIQFVNTYGLQRFIDRCDELASRYGERFKAPGIVAEKLAAGEVFE